MPQWGAAMKDELPRALSELRHARALMVALLERIGERDDCPDCGARIYSVRHRRTNLIESYDPDGASHSFHCRDAVLRRRLEMAKAATPHPSVLTE